MREILKEVGLMGMSEEVEREVGLAGLERWESVVRWVLDVGSGHD